jgi:uncharacterized protein (TIGR03435 family)
MKVGAVSACFMSFVALAQQATNKPAFEVASVKASDPNPSNPMWIGMDADGGMVRYTNITLKDCIRAAWRVRDFQIQGPAWISDARFEITAKIPAGAASEQIPEMLQMLLTDRFKLELRHDQKEQPIYALVGKGGPKLKLAAATPESKPSPTAVGPDGKPRAAIMFQILNNGVRLAAPSATLASYVEILSRFTARPVVDMTGLEDRYDLALTFTPEVTSKFPSGVKVPDAQSVDAAPSVFDAVQQYGLRLEPRKVALDMLTVVRAERTPTEN